MRTRVYDLGRCSILWIDLFSILSLSQRSISTRWLVIFSGFIFSSELDTFLMSSSLTEKTKRFFLKPQNVIFFSLLLLQRWMECEEKRKHFRETGRLPTQSENALNLLSFFFRTVKKISLNSFFVYWAFLRRSNSVHWLSRIWRLAQKRTKFGIQTQDSWVARSVKATSVLCPAIPC